MYGGIVPELADASDAAKAKANSKSFHMLSYSILGVQEQTRVSRVTRIGLIQNKWPADTSAPIADQIKAIQARIGDIIDAAGDMGVKVRPRYHATLSCWVPFVSGWCWGVSDCPAPMCATVNLCEQSFRAMLCKLQ